MTMLAQRANFGWLPDLPDARDWLAFPSKSAVHSTAMPVSVDLRSDHQFTVHDQGNAGSCVAQAIASAIEYEQHRRPDDPNVSDFLEQDRKFPVSRLFLYYEARRPIGLLHEDSGCHIRDAMRVAHNIGVPRESGWQYETHRVTTSPKHWSYRSAPYHKITSYKSVAVDMNEIRLALASGSPVVFGIMLYSSFNPSPVGASRCRTRRATGRGAGMPCSPWATMTRLGMCWC